MCDIHELRQICNVRKAPFVLQFGCKLYVRDGDHFYECGNISEAFMAWVMIMYGVYDGVPPSRGVSKPRLSFIDRVVDELIGKLPEEMITRFSSWISELLDRTKTTNHQSDDDSDASESDSNAAIDDEDDDDDEVPWLQALFY